MKGFFIYAAIICSMILYFYTMITINKIINGSDSKMDAKLISHILGGSVLVGVTMYILISALFS